MQVTPHFELKSQISHPQGSLSWVLSAIYFIIAMVNIWFHDCVINISLSLDCKER